MWCERLCVKEEGRSGGSELGSDLDLDPKKKLQIPIRQNDADPLDPKMETSVFKQYGGSVTILMLIQILLKQREKMSSKNVFQNLTKIVMSNCPATII